jgi:Holliday junction resolvasome RuvABC endonuclease subunit
MSILALDVSFAAVGWVVFVAGKPVRCGVIRTEPPQRRQKLYAASANVHRAMSLAREIRALIEEHQVKGIVAELPHGGSKSAQASHKMGIAIGAVSALIELTGLPAEYVQPGDVKLAMCGARSAGKNDVIRAAKAKFGKDMRFPAAVRNAEHVADACGAYWACRDSLLVRVLSRDQDAGEPEAAARYS